MGTGANYTEYIIGHFAINVHEVLPISVTNVSWQAVEVVDLNFQAVEKAFLHDSPQPIANTNILAADIIPDLPPTDFRTQVIMSNSGNFSVVITNGGDSQTGLLNANSPVGITLIPGALYTFDVLVHDGDSINFRYSSSGGTIKTLRVQEIDASAY